MKKALEIGIAVILAAIALYIAAWVVLLPLYGTMRCAHWNKEVKCDQVSGGLIDFSYHFKP